MKVIINADDFGCSSPVNDAIIKGFEIGIIDRTTAMANAPYFVNACQLAIKKGFENCVGVHFNITDGKSVSSKIAQMRSFCTEDGTFTYHRNAKLLLSRREMDAISAECNDQILKFHDQGLYPTRLDSHQHVHTEWFIFQAIEPLLQPNGLLSVRLSQNIGDLSIKNRVYKKIFNRYLKRHKWNCEEFCSSYSAFMKLKEFSKMTEATIEVVVHPILNSNGLLVDAITGEELIPVLKKIKNLDHSIGWNG